MEMDEPVEEGIQCSEMIDLHSMRSRISDLRDTYGRSKDESKLSPSESNQLLKDSAFHVEGKISEFLLEFSDIGTLAAPDLDAFLSVLKNELNSMDAENAMISNEIEDLKRKSREDSNSFESELESLDCLTKLATLQGSEEIQVNDGQVDCFSHGEEEKELINATKRNNFKMFELSQQIEENKMTLKSLQDLECMFVRFEAIEKIEDLLSGVKVIEYEGNSMRLSLKTHIPNLESLLCRKQLKDLSEPSEHNHELLIEVVDGTMELKNVEIFPDDVYLGEIVDAAKSFRQLSSDMLAVGIRSPLEWFVRRVQERIVLCSLRMMLVKSANKSSNSIEYLDREETLIAHMVGGVDAFIKISQGWPLSNHALKLISLKSTSRSNDISLSFLCRIEELSNSLDMQVRNNLCNFVDAIQAILKQQARAELQPETSSEN
ncbi:uncharacterized protein LOC124926210 [Impatiens glandulifera]|uniref:uncharacterized protein LOC124926210 n=1 Tax=Impatiens glandulifera TaxID=253017 RepID=UPI001FB0CA72|nr:uncharacterized protein LOC124926210 [Impatiens glandulifera]